MKIISSLCIAVLLATACNDNVTEKGGHTTTGTDTTATATNADTAHHAANSLDLAGNYEGTLPCASCEGIKTALALNADESFTLKEEYLGKKDPLIANAKGKWVVHENTITLQFDKELQDRRVQYKAGENTLWLLDQEGKEITGSLADKYVLKKTH
jgi:uncharacterized lipoprotein NlpE involved in copper resistance